MKSRSRCSGGSGSSNGRTSGAMLRPAGVFVRAWDLQPSKPIAGKNIVGRIISTRQVRHQNRTRSHKIAQHLCLTTRCGSIIGEMVVSNCARRLAGRIFMSRAIRAVSIRAVRHDQRASLMRHHQIVLRYSTSVNMLNLTAENYETMPTFLAKTKPSKRPLAGLSRNSRSVRGSARRRESRVCRGTAQQVKRQIERLVILGVRRNVGLRTGFLLAFGAQVPTQRGLAPGGYPRLELLGHILQHLDVGHDSLCLDGTSRRRVVA